MSQPLSRIFSFENKFKIGFWVCNTYIIRQEILCKLVIWVYIVFLLISFSAHLLPPITGFHWQSLEYFIMHHVSKPD